MQADVVNEFIAEQDWLDEAGQQVQGAVQQVLGGSQRLRDLLHGTWLGHPLHPVLTDVPTGAWTATLVCDLLSLATDDERWERGADAALGAGLVGAVASAATGLADWSHTGGQTRRVGLVHAIFNTLAAVLYSVSFARRLSGHRSGAIGLSSTGYVCMLAGAFLGGELVFRLGTGINRNAWTQGPARFKAAMRDEELQEGKPVKVQLDGTDVLLVRQGGSIYAIENTCSHESGPLNEGKLEGENITCPWHGSTFCLVDGRVVHGPATAPQPRYQVRVRSGQIELRRLEA